jgi:hypothetical protein
MSTPAEIIEQAAWALWRASGSPDGVAKRDPYRTVARALADAGLLADPELAADRRRIIAEKLELHIERNQLSWLHAEAVWRLDTLSDYAGDQANARRAAETERDMLRIDLNTTEEQLADARRERDLAVAHDRQPYPTAWAYEQACRSLNQRDASIDKALALLADTALMPMTIGDYQALKYDVRAALTGGAE